MKLKRGNLLQPLTAFHGSTSPGVPINTSLQSAVSIPDFLRGGSFNGSVGGAGGLSGGLTEFGDPLTPTASYGYGASGQYSGIVQIGGRAIVVGDANGGVNVVGNSNSAGSGYEQRQNSNGSASGSNSGRLRMTPMKVSGSRGSGGKSRTCSPLSSPPLQPDNGLISVALSQQLKNTMQNRPPVLNKLNTQQREPSPSPFDNSNATPKLQQPKTRQPQLKQQSQPQKQQQQVSRRARFSNDSEESSSDEEDFGNRDSAQLEDPVTFNKRMTSAASTASTLSNATDVTSTFSNTRINSAATLNNNNVSNTITNIGNQAASRRLPTNSNSAANSRVVSPVSPNAVSIFSAANNNGGNRLAGISGSIHRNQARQQSSGLPSATPTSAVSAVSPTESQSQTTTSTDPKTSNQSSSTSIPTALPTHHNSTMQDKPFMVVVFP
ncbi:unnamed protein product [Ambrosiozyma monospora]|uniref:Unnamed protein product n=1 Tax=Ambrosiozyma monospora TaxID=43982 RepID=A0ACB5TEA1_AMBMO|nr:unnamed protein product [Ambrosiozyma monospora]